MFRAGKDAAKKFKGLAELAEQALEFDADGQLAQAQRNWSKVLPGAVDPPKNEDLEAEIRGRSPQGQRLDVPGSRRAECLQQVQAGHPLRKVLR